MSISYSPVTPRGIGRTDYSRSVEIYQIEPELLFMEGFEGLPANYDTLTTVGSTIVRDTTLAWKGGASLRYTMGALAANWAEYRAPFGVVRSRKMLLTLAVALRPVFSQVQMELRLFDGTNRIRFRVIYDSARGWLFLDSNGTNQPVTDGIQALRMDNRAFHRFQVAVDFDTEEYLYIQSNDKIMYLTGIAGENTVDATDPFVRVAIQCASGVVGGFYNIDEVRVSELI